MFGYHNTFFSKNLLTKLKRYATMVATSGNRDVIRHDRHGLEGGILLIGGQKKENYKMSGTKAGGLKAAATNREKYGKEFYSQIGRKGGQNGHTGGFAANPALARIAGAKGGRISRRGPAKKAA